MPLANGQKHHSQGQRPWNSYAGMFELANGHTQNAAGTTTKPTLKLTGGR